VPVLRDALQTLQPHLQSAWVYGSVATSSMIKMLASEWLMFDSEHTFASDVPKLCG